MREVKACERSIRRDAYGSREVQTTYSIRRHGDSYQAFGISSSRFSRETGGFFPEHKGISAAINNCIIPSGRMGCEEPESFAEIFKGLIKARVDGDLKFVPVIQSGALERAIVDGKAKRLDEVECTPGRSAQARDVSGIGWDLRFHEDDVKRGIGKLIGIAYALRRLRHGGVLVKRTSSFVLCPGAMRYATPPWVSHACSKES